MISNFKLVSFLKHKTDFSNGKQTTSHKYSSLSHQVNVEQKYKEYQFEGI